MKALKIFLIVMFSGTALIALLWLVGSRLTVGSYTITSDKLTQQIRIVCVSDLHGCEYGKDNAELLARIDALQPDLLVFPGDMFPDSEPYDTTLAFFRAVAAKYPCYYVAGNHEIKHGSVVEKLELAEKTGVVVLDNREETLVVRGQTLRIFGVRDPQDSMQGFTRSLARLGAAANENEFNLLLAHRPQFLEQYAAYSFDLVVSGHAHGGQWRIPGILPEGLFAPDQGLFPKITGGCYRSGETEMVVSRGLAKQYIVPRIFNTTELVSITLTPQ